MATIEDYTAQLNDPLAAKWFGDLLTILQIIATKDYNSTSELALVDAVFRHVSRNAGERDNKYFFLLDRLAGK